MEVKNSVFILLEASCSFSLRAVNRESISSEMKRNLSRVKHMFSTQNKSRRDVIPIESGNEKKIIWNLSN